MCLAGQGQIVPGAWEGCEDEPATLQWCCDSSGVQGLLISIWVFLSQVQKRMVSPFPRMGNPFSLLFPQQETKGTQYVKGKASVRLRALALCHCGWDPCMVRAQSLAESSCALLLLLHSGFWGAGRGQDAATVYQQTLTVALTLELTQLLVENLPLGAVQRHRSSGRM